MNKKKKVFLKDKLQTSFYGSSEIVIVASGRGGYIDQMKTKRYCFPSW